MSEELFVHVGQAGVQIGSSCWELFCFEHGIQPDGQLPEREKATDGIPFGSAFESSGKSKFTARAIMFDQDSETIDRIRSGPYRSLFGPGCLVSSVDQHGASDNYATGWLLGKTRPLEAPLRQLLEACDNPASITITHAMGGGCGSALSAHLLSELQRQDYVSQKFSVTTCSVLPGEKDAAVVSPYNAMFNVSELVNSSDLSIMMDNPALYNRCKTLGVEQPCVGNLNRLVAQALSCVTASSRFESPLRRRIADLAQDICPFQRTKFASMSYGPLAGGGAAAEAPCVGELTSSLLENESQFLCMSPASGKFLGINGFYRGDVTAKDVHDTVCAKRAELADKFCAMLPPTMGCGITYRQPSHPPGSDLVGCMRSAALVMNNTAIRKRFQVLASKFDTMYSKRAFVFWYVGEGMEEGEFCEARENLDVMMNDYEEVEKMTGVRSEDDE
eukprot:TRINITY_DN47299_c0_g1_i1.p1 TRINITY_DN47299_c0_g1~~TRINITY_DN47299_c0_g1_i1.p1  ORF type:complete len:446 (+),score=62.91 TRINITY_DN47299_c0_g1_i1:60-1397(+)